MKRKRRQTEGRDMIRTLRARMMAIVMVFVTAVIVMLVITIHQGSAYMNSQYAHSYLNSIAENTDDSESSLRYSSKNPYTRAWQLTIELDENQDVISYNSDWTSLPDDEFLAELVSTVCARQRSFGKIGRLFYLRTDTDDGQIIFLVDNSVGFAAVSRSTWIAFLAGAIAWVILLFLVRFLINRMTVPIDRMLHRQRQFISDAGHELKTPLASILANADVLQDEIGSNPHLNFIHDESRRMEQLVKSLMSLTVLESAETPAPKKNFSISDAVLETTLPLESLAFERGITIDTDVPPEIFFYGNEDQIKQLVVIFLNNAIKYGNEGGQIRISLKREAKWIALGVYNTGVGVALEEREQIFDRFYRSDRVRNGSGSSFGLGLSIAKAIVSEHQGEITVDGKFGEWVEFTATFPYEYRKMVAPR